MMITAHYDQIDSTNLRARNLAQTNPGQPLLVSARRQLAGRGRLGRTWQSPTGGAWFSLAWPCRHAVDAYSQASLTAGLVMHRVLCERYGLDAASLQVKWPNDLLLDGRKVCGILCEWQAGGPGAPGTLIVGVGVNVAIDMAQLPAELRQRAGTIRSTWRDEADGEAIATDVRSLIDVAGSRLIEALRRFENIGFDTVTRESVQARLAWMGQVVNVRMGGRQWSGRILGLDDHGRLEVTGVDGRGAERLDSGEINEVRCGVASDEPTRQVGAGEYPQAKTTVATERIGASK